jgi:hypothetical protein
VLLRSLVAMLLSIPATTAIIGVVLVLVPVNHSLLMSLLLMAFPVWVLVSSAAYLAPHPAASAAILGAISIIGFGLIAALKYAGLSGL